ncbi:MAG: hypothetical protein KJ048_14730 [Dehalococcoidia bacterium]|nr:hypothetical protein [Dehalococcoidia bacterium]
MTLFDPHSHHLIHQLRQEQLARKAERRKQLRLDTLNGPSAASRIAGAVRAVAARVPQRGSSAPRPAHPASPEPR